MFDLTERLELEKQLRHSHKMEAVGQLAAGVAHDFNNLLTIITGQVSLALLDAALPASHRKAFQTIQLASERAATLTRQLLTFSRRQPMQPKDLDLNEVIAHIIPMLTRAVGEHIEVLCRYAPQLPAIRADRGMLEQVLTNLAVNARDAMPKKGTLTIETAAVMIDDAYIRNHPQARTGAFVRLRMADTGCGIPPEIIGRIFEPFFTTKEVGKGTGLGLASVYGIVELHKGWIEVESEVGQGTVFSLYFPALNYGINKETQPTRLEKLPRGQETILVVEDDPILRQLVVTVLRQFGYQVHEAASGQKAMNLLQAMSEPIDLLFTDLVMPDGVSGRDLAEWIQQNRGSVPVIYTSGYSLEVAGRDLTLNPGENFIAKPYAAPELLRVIRQKLDAAKR